MTADDKIQNLNDDFFEMLLFGISVIEIDNIEENQINCLKNELNNDINLDTDLDDLLNDLNNHEDLKNIKSNISLEDAVNDFQSGYMSAYEYLYNHYKPIMIRYGKRYNNEDLAMEILDIVLLNAAKTFDKTAKTKFNTYYWKCVHNHVNCNRIKDNAQKRAHNKNMRSLDEKRSFDNESNESDLGSTIEDVQAIERDRINELKLSIMSLNKYLKQNEITMLLKIIDNYTLQEIGDSLGITAAAVCLSLKRISKKTQVANQLKEILQK